eukprot:TRINITY_DN1004_c0_g1_i12.p1 TRINITY_DN1004_c0_g1~~TRINITY_DN1004_c0_g1_i12.p1  ORF type:complete len:1731 (-),score=878.12 TRINITY_DN1004_c0_g1_i12:335-5527(-)
MAWNMGGKGGWGAAQSWGGGWGGGKAAQPAVAKGAPKGLKGAVQGYGKAPAGKAATPAKSPQEALKEKTAKDTADAKIALAACTKDATAAEGIIEALSKRATTTTANPPKAEEALEKALASIETAAMEAQKKVDAARQEITGKLTATKTMVLDVKKQQTTDLQALLTKLATAATKLQPLKTFKKEFTKMAEIKKALTEAGTKLLEHEANATKAEALAKGAELSEEDMKKVDELVGPAQRIIPTTKALINAKSKMGGDVVKADVEKLTKRVDALAKKVETVTTKIKGQKADKAVAEWGDKGTEHATKVEELLTKCQDAEMPFLKGMEVLPKEESDDALAKSDAAAKDAAVALVGAKNFFKTKMVECKSFGKEVSEGIIAQLKPLSERVDKVDAKVKAFQKETSERKIAALMSEALTSIVIAEKSSKALEEESKTLADDSDVDALKEVITKMRESCGETGKLIQMAKKVMGDKQREAGKGQANSPPMKKAQERLHGCDAKVNKVKAAIAGAEKAIKVKAVLETESKKVAELEGEVKKVVAAVPAEGKEMTEETVKAMDEGIAATNKKCGEINSHVSSAMQGTTGASKEALQKLLDAKNEALKALTKLKTDNKERREKVLSKAYVAEATKRGEALEAGKEAMAKAELPFLKGIEVLPLKETKALVETSTAACVKCNEAITKAKNYMQNKGNETKAFGAEAKKVWEDGISGFADKCTEANKSLTTFKKDTEERGKAARIQEADSMVEEAEGAVKTAKEALEFFKQDGAADFDEGKVADPLKKFLDSEKEMKSKVSSAKGFLNQRQKDVAGNTENQEKLKTLKAKLDEATKTFSEERKPVVVHEQKYMAKTFLAEVKAKAANIDSEVTAATAACKGLIEDKGLDLLVDSSKKTLRVALQAHMKEKDLTIDALFKEAAGKAKKIKIDAFTKWMGTLVEKTGHEELGFTAERKTAVAKLIAGKDGVGPEEFKALFSVTYAVNRPVSVTKAFEVSEETVCKLESGSSVTLFGEQKEDNKGLLRSECKTADGQTGWVTIKQHKSAFMYESSAFKAATSKMDAAVMEHLKKVNEVMNFINAKMKEGGAQSEGALADARKAMTEEKDKVKAAQKAIETLKQTLQKAKQEWQATERSELNAHIDAKNKAAAEEFVKPAKAPAEAAEKEAKKIAAAAKEFLALDAEGVLAFKKPSELVAKLEGLLSAATEKAGEARKVMTEQTKVAKEAHKEKVDAAKEKSETPPSNGGVQEVQAQFQGLTKAIDDEMKAGRKALADCRAKVNSIVAKYTADVKTAIRKAASAKGNVEKLYLSLANKKDKVSTADMAKFLQTLDCLKGKAEHATLVASNIQKDGVSKYRFLTYAQLYYKVLKDIAFTDSLNLESCKTLRKAEQGELVELIEGPVTDEKSGVKRIKASSMIDNVSGWMTVQGNQGTPFLEESQKLYFSAKKEQAMEDKSEVGSKELRKVMEDEVFELVEGPSKVTGGDILRAKVKTSKDQITGWVTIKDGSGTVICKDTAEMTIKQSIALTDGQDAKTSKVLRKLEVGEKLQVTGELIEDKETGTSRVKCKALKDNKEGWVTTKGNKSTVYADVTSKTYTVVKEVQMQTQFKTGSPNGKRKLEAGETMTVLEGPKEEKAQTLERVKVRALSDSKIGWISRTDALCKRWSPVYRVSQPAPLQKARSPAACEGIEPVRELTKGEALDVVEGPVCEDGVMRVRGMAVKDGEAGWVTIKGTDGKRYLD